MKNNKLFIVFLIFLILLLLGALIFFNFSTEIEQDVEIESSFLPEEEITNEDNNETEIKLYFEDKASNLIVPENRKINAKDLIDNPYTIVLNLLLSGPIDTNKYYNLIPKGTNLNNIKLKTNTLYIDLNENFLNGDIKSSINAIVNTVCQFNEIEKVKFTIDGKENALLNNFYSINNF